MHEYLLLAQVKPALGYRKDHLREVESGVASL